MNRNLFWRSTKLWNWRELRFSLKNRHGHCATTDHRREA